MGGGASAVDTRAFAEHLRRFISYPLRARIRGWEGNVSVSFRLAADGRAHDVRVVVSSGFLALDRSAVDAVRRASPFAPAPGRELALILPVTYCLR
jgi:protein TonB